MAGPAAAIVAVAAVERVHGPAALVHHPALGILRPLLTGTLTRHGAKPSPWRQESQG